MNTKICPTCKSPIPANAPGGFCPACLLRDADEPAPAGRKAPPLAEIAAAFPQLEVEALIGQGGMGFVYKARQPSLDRTVALKILSPELSRDPAFAERFAREARVLGKLNHTNIVTVFEHGQSGGFFYLLMEYVDGVNLRQAMRAGRFTPQQALAVVPSICDALQAAHAQGVWHRDIKPENILLDARGGVKIADFGIARIVGDPGRDFTLTSTGAALGSAPYMAPEQHEKPHDVDHRADIYSLGVVIYEMLTGELPLGRFPAPSERAAVSARIDEIVLQTLEKERSLRQQSAEEVKTDVHRAAKDAGVRSPTSRNDEPAPITTWSIGLAVGGLVLFGAASGFTRGSTQGVLLTFAMVAIVLGFIGGCIALAKMRRDQIRRAWRPGLRVLVWSPVVASVLGFIAVVLWMVPMRRMEAMNAEREAMRAVMARAEAEKAMVELRRSQASNTALPEPQHNPQADARSAVMAPGLPLGEPAVPVEEVFREMNGFANEANGEDFQRHLVPSWSAGNRTMAYWMDPFYGRILLLKRVTETHVTGRKVVQLFATMKRNDTTVSYRLLEFTPKQGVWCFLQEVGPEYRATYRVEFRPEKGDALAILKTHLQSDVIIAPVAGATGQFEIHVKGTPADAARENAANSASWLDASLKRAGLGETYKLIQSAEEPTKPWLAEEAPAPKMENP